MPHLAELLAKSCLQVSSRVGQFGGPFFFGTSGRGFESLWVRHVFPCVGAKSERWRLARAPRFWHVFGKLPRVSCSEERARSRLADDRLVRERREAQHEARAGHAKESPYFTVWRSPARDVRTCRKVGLIRGGTKVSALTPGSLDQMSWAAA